MGKFLTIFSLLLAFAAHPAQSAVLLSQPVIGTNGYSALPDNPYAAKFSLSSAASLLSVTTFGQNLHTPIDAFVVTIFSDDSNLPSPPHWRSWGLP